jgi:psiF repeat
VKLSLIRFACSGVAASVLLCSGFFATSAAAADMTQQEKMSACSKQNKGKKGDDYKQSQSDCLKNGPTPVAAAPMTPQQKMAACSKQNKGKKGDDFKNAQSACLKS